MGNKYPNEGHRQRLRNRFLKNGLEGFLDYEIIELLLTLGTPRKDCKQSAKEAINKFKNLNGALDAPKEELTKIKGIGEKNYFGLKLFQEISLRTAKERVPKKQDLKSLKSTVNYLQKLIGDKHKEYFVVFYLDAQNRIIDSRTISVGTLNKSLVHPREVFKPAIDLNSTAILIAHNHPSGEVEPSSEDRAITKNLIEAGNLIGIKVIDHVIISKRDFFSFKQQLLI